MSAIKRLVAVLLFVVAVAPLALGQIYWTNQSPAGISDDIWCVTYGNGTFAAVTNQGNLLASTNGLTWSSQAIDQGVWLTSIAYGNGLWVVVGNNGTTLVSPDLKTWVHAISGTSNRLNGVLYDGSVWVAVGEAGTIITSPDAQTWTIQPSGVTGFLRGISSFRGEDFISGQNGVNLIGYGVSAGSFFQNLTGTTQNLEAILIGPQFPNVTVAVGANGTILNDNDDSYNFQPAPVNYSGTFRGLTFGGGYYLAVGDQGTLFTSTDGISWTQRFSGDSPSTLSTSTLLSAAYSPTSQRFVATGTGGTILVSTPPPTTFVNVSTQGYVTRTTTLIGGFVIEGTASRTVLIRADGPALSTFNVPNPLPDPVLTVYNSNGAVIATNTGWTTNANPATISTAALEVGAFPLPNLSADSVLLVTLQPGAYTAQITSAKGYSGMALFEAYTD